MSSYPTSPVIRLEADNVRQTRYPSRVWLDGALVDVRCDADTDDTLIGSIADDPNTKLLPASDVPVLVGIDALPRLTQTTKQDASAPPLADRNWLPLLPFARSADLQIARERVAAGDIDTPRLVEITIPLGAPQSQAWELDHVAAMSLLEALVFGAHAAEHVTGARVESSAWIRDTPQVRVMMHHLAGQVDVVQRIIPADMAPVSAIDGEIVGDAGRILLRREFAPGAVGVWQRDRPGYWFPTVQQPKDDVQAPDSITGGWELASILQSLVTSSAETVGLRDDAVRLTHHMSSMMSGGHDER